ncbi:hypothetical protein [Cellulosilyticum sp. WCF-2]|uniref:hypothetical protein n=1 Tax=Cellulosilyticum sp. WCF-2 TaxID=2497860 RepID=UPI000F8DBF43|nr:hypothetical protein [Cellulosilyticum sp. WCF-2]QEH70186.1 hypothetical protein EKH84_18045 [Cellulosilyticum sp. WCF-2]
MFDFMKKKRRIVLNEQPEEEVKVTNSNVNLKKEYVSDILKSRKLPIVLLDPLWHTMRDSIQSDIIKAQEKNLKELLKEQGRLNNDYKEYSTVKQNFLKEILNLSGEVQVDGNSESIEALNKLHQSTVNINQKLEDIEKRISEVEVEIESANREIIEEMIAVGYEYIDVCKEKEIRLEREITQLREQMLLKTAEKKKCEKLLKDVYNYLHSIVGREQIEVIDRGLGDKK